MAALAAGIAGEGEGAQGEGGQPEGAQGEGAQGEGAQPEGAQGEGAQGGGGQGSGGQGEGGQGEGAQGEGAQGGGGQGSGGQGEGGQGEGGQGEGGQGGGGEGGREGRAVMEMLNESARSRPPPIHPPTVPPEPEAGATGCAVEVSTTTTPARSLPAAAATVAAEGAAAAGKEGEEGGRKGVRLPRWSGEEEANLRRLVAEEGANNWGSKAQRLGTDWVRSANAVQQYYFTMVRKDSQESKTGSRIIGRNLGVKRRREPDDGKERQGPSATSHAGRPSADDGVAYLAKMGRSTAGSSRELSLRVQEVQRWAGAVARAQAGDEPAEQRPLVAVTGAGGYLGGNVIAQLLAQNYRVRGTVRSLETLRNEETARQLREIRMRFPTVELFPCDLLSGPSRFTNAFDGVSYVIHTACPNQTRAKDPMGELFRPAVEGVKAVIAAARAAGVKRVVMTSSCGAVQSNRLPTARDHAWSEKDWNDDSSIRVAPYRYAKTYAERVAWKCAEGSAGSDGKAVAPVDLVTICPAMILGPPIYCARKTPGLSVRYLTAILEGKFRTGVPGGPCFGIVDVRDVAAAHIKAMLEGRPDVKAEGGDESRPTVEMAATAADTGAADPAGSDRATAAEPTAAEPPAAAAPVDPAGESKPAGISSASGGDCAQEKSVSGAVGGTNRKRYVLSSAAGVTAMEIVDCLNDSEQFIEKHSWVCGCMPDSALTETSYRPRYDVAKAAADLGVTCRPWEQTIVEMADAVVELGIVQPPLSARMQYAKTDVTSDVWGAGTSLLQNSNVRPAGGEDHDGREGPTGRNVNTAAAMNGMGAGAGRAGGGRGKGRGGGARGGGRAGRGDGSAGSRVTYFWTQEEMDKLVKIVQDEGLGHWDRKAWLLGTNRSAGSVEQKYYVITRGDGSRPSRQPAGPNDLPGSVSVGSGGGAKLGKWTESEMATLVSIVREQGLGEWEQKAIALGTGRSAGAVEQKYYVITREVAHTRPNAGSGSTSTKFGQGLYAGERPA